MYARVGLRNETLRFNCAYTATVRCSFNVRKRENIQAISKWTCINSIHLSREKHVKHSSLARILRLYEIHNKKLSIKLSFAFVIALYLNNKSHFRKHKITF